MKKSILFLTTFVVLGFVSQGFAAKKHTRTYTSKPHESYVILREGSRPFPNRLCYDVRYGREVPCFVDVRPRHYIERGHRRNHHGRAFMFGWPF